MFSQFVQSTIKQGRSKFPPATEYIILYSGITPDHGYSTVLELLNLVLGVYGGWGGRLWTFERTFDTLQGDVRCVSPALKGGGHPGSTQKSQNDSEKQNYFFSCSPGFCFELLFLQSVLDLFLIVPSAFVLDLFF